MADSVTGAAGGGAGGATSGLPASIALAWGLRDRPSRGPKPGLTLDRIVAAGIAVATTDGLPAVRMSRVAAELGVATMTLYRYVAAKDDLLTLMVDTALGPPPPAPPGEDWRAGLRRWAVGVRSAYLRGPWALRVPITAPPLGPNNVRWLEDGLHALRDTPLDERQKVSCVLLVSGFVRNAVTLAVDTAHLQPSGPTPDATYGRALVALTDERTFPAVHRVIASGAFDDGEDDSAAEFEFGLTRILDGIAVLIAAQT